MIKKTSLLIYLYICILSSLGATQLSNTSYFSILTCAPGTEIHAHFGHTAIRLCDSASGIDVVFNYGIFRYTDDFAYNFVKGETYYQLGVQKFSSFVSEYYMDNRGVIEQKLRLTQNQKQTLFNLLQTNYLPENRKYLYNFFYDNCSSRPRDLLIQVLGDTLKWNKPTQVISDTLWMHTTQQHLINKEIPSWRTFIHTYVGNDSWLRFGISLALGIPTDKQPSLIETMFLPDCLFLLLESATIHQNNSQMPIVETTQVLVPHTPIINSSSLLFYPATIMWIACLFFLIIAFIEYRIRRHFYGIDSFVYFVFGCIGILVWYVSFISIHPAVFPNINALWALPIHILFSILVLIPRARIFSHYYIHITTGLLAIYTLLALISLQYIHLGQIALVIILLSRNPYISKLRTI